MVEKINTPRMRVPTKQNAEQASNQEIKKTPLQNASISDQIFKIKKSRSQTSYLSFILADINYAINIQNIITIIDTPNLIYLSHMSPPIVGLQHYNDAFIPVLDFAGYRPHASKNHADLNNNKIIVLSTSCFRKDQPFGLIVDNVGEIQYFKQSDLVQNKQPFNNLLPAYFYALNKNLLINLLDISDLANQIE